MLLTTISGVFTYFNLHQQVAADISNRAAPAATLATHSFCCGSAHSGEGTRKIFSPWLEPAIGGPEQDLPCIMFNVFVEQTRRLES